MPAKIDLTGRRFGKLIVMQLDESHPIGRGRFWKCLCDCGNIITRSTTSLRRKKGSVKSCGCLWIAAYKKNGYANNKNIEGVRFGRLVAVRPTQRRSFRGIVWKCLCDCGNIVFISIGNLGSGNTKSCKCLKKEMTSRRTQGDITGHRSGALVALNSTGKKIGTNYIWKFQCDCGEITYRTLNDFKTKIVRGSVQSCGCLFHATCFVCGTNINPMDVPFEITNLVKARIGLEKAIKQAV